MTVAQRTSYALEQNALRREWSRSQATMNFPELHNS